MILPHTGYGKDRNINKLKLSDILEILVLITISNKSSTLKILRLRLGLM